MLRSVPAILLITAMMGAGCSDHGNQPLTPAVEITDASLFATQAGGGAWTWFGLSSDTLTGGSTTAHEPRIRVRYNARAASQLTSSGRVRAGTAFPDSSLIVKELYTGSSLTTIAYMFKLRGAANASDEGWVWAETDAEGRVKIPASRRGTGCEGCHSTGIDFTRMNDSHP